MNIPVEAIEIDYPIRIRRYELAPDTGGGGNSAAGSASCGNTRCSPKGSSINVRGDRAKFAPKGVHGGQDGAKSNYLLFDAEAPRGREIPSKFSGQIGAATACA